jgi:hypothetical protein
VRGLPFNVHLLEGEKEDTTMSKLFSVIEHSSFFAVRHNPSGDEHPMGDGVDTLFDQDGKVLVPGTPGFVEIWEDVLNAYARTTLEAYFLDHLED